MSLPSNDWREALATALLRTLRIECDDGQLAHALRDVSGTRLPSLEESIRRQYWHAELPGFAWQLGAQPDERSLDAQLFCAGCHRDGRIRERALRLIRDRQTPLAVALFLLRCDDWVPQVRPCAEQALRQRLSDEPDALFTHFDLLTMLRERSRIREGAWSSLIEPSLTAAPHRDRRWAALDSSRGRARLFAYALIQHADPEDADALALRALQDRDPTIALWALRELLPPTDATQADELLAHALHHPHASVRAQALRLRARSDDPALRTLLHASLLDPSVSVRSVAAHATRALGLDPRDAWRAALDHGAEPQNRHALRSLADCAAAEDLDRIAPWLKHANGELRCAALRAALHAGIDDPAAQLRDALASPSGKVVALALKLGAGLSGFMTRETLAHAFAAAANALTRRRSLDATRKLGRWDALDCLLDAIHHDARSNEAVQALDAWQREIGQRYAPLSAPRKQALLQRIDAMTPQAMHIAWLPVRRVVEAG